VARFVLLALLVGMLLSACAELALEAIGLTGGAAELARVGLAPGALPGHLRLGAWLLDAAAMTVLVLLLTGRTGRWWLEGLAAGLLAWIYRGPLTVLSALATARLPLEPFWRAARASLIVLPLLGLALAALARRMLGEPWD
jgi:hypothetical protein